MPITRPHICEQTLAAAEPDDHGNVTITLYGDTGNRYAGLARQITPDEARELATELTTAATTADQYRLEQKDTGR